MPHYSLDLPTLKRLTETPSVGTACGPVVSILGDFFSTGFTRTVIPDGFCLFQPAGATPEQLRAVFVAHMDEIGGCVHAAISGGEGRFACRFWGTRDPGLYAGADLQAYDYLATASHPTTISVKAEMAPSDIIDEPILLIRAVGDDSVIRPYRTVFTFRQETAFDDTHIYAKAVDPRVTLYAVCEAVRRLSDARIGALVVMAEECAIDVARKAVTYLSRRSPDLGLVVNADVPSPANLDGADLDMPAIRVFERGNFIDPSFGIRVASELIDAGVAVALSAARSGSQTNFFTPLAPTLSIALPGEDIHTARGRMSLLGAERCIDLLTVIGERMLGGRLTTAS
jgi:putative aminopeptidase FrvX